jgi:hypothetical protein
MGDVCVVSSKKTCFNNDCDEIEKGDVGAVFCCLVFVFSFIFKQAGTGDTTSTEESVGDGAVIVVVCSTAVLVGGSTAVGVFGTSGCFGGSSSGLTLSSVTMKMMVVSVLQAMHCLLIMIMKHHHHELLIIKYLLRPLLVSKWLMSELIGFFTKCCVVHGDDLQFIDQRE